MDWGQILENALRAAINRDAVVLALAALGLNLHFGWTGLLNFGQAGFLAMGAYGTAITVEYFGQSLWLGLGVGILAAVALALVLGVPTLRLRADYLAIVTIAFAELIRLVLRSNRYTWFTGGSSGINQFADSFYDLNPFPSGRYGLGPFTFRSFEWWPLVVGWTLVALVALTLFLLMRSPWGRVVKSIREDEDAVRSLGKNVYAYKMQSLIIGGVIGAMAGFVGAIWNQSVQPDSFGTATTFFAYTALILGGAAKVKGPIVGAMIFWLLLAFTDSFLREAVDNDLIPTSIMAGTQVGQVRLMLVGLGLVILMVFRPQGIFGNRREIELDAR